MSPPQESPPGLPGLKPTSPHFTLAPPSTRFVFLHFTYHSLTAIDQVIHIYSLPSQGQGFSAGSTASEVPGREQILGKC